jgi:hypothetical protein
VCRRFASAQNGKRSQPANKSLLLFDSQPQKVALLKAKSIKHTPLHLYIMVLGESELETSKRLSFLISKAYLGKKTPKLETQDSNTKQTCPRPDESRKSMRRNGL